MGKIIAVVSGKGGTGKTSITGGVGACLALLDAHKNGTAPPNSMTQIWSIYSFILWYEQFFVLR